MSERRIDVDLEECIRLFEGTRWKFYELIEDERIVRVEVPKGDELLTVELPWSSKVPGEEIAKKLRDEGFIRYSIKTRRR